MTNKFLIGIFTAFIFGSALAISTTTAAEANNSVKIDNSGKITLTSDNAASDGITSLQLSLEVNTDKEAEVSFAFNSENSIKISEYRYNEDTNRLNIYMAGTDPLFESDLLDIGTVYAKDESGNDVSFEVTATEESLKYVYQNKLVESNELNVDIEAPETTTSTTVTTTETTTTTTSTEPTTTTTEPTTTTSTEPTTTTTEPTTTTSTEPTTTTTETTTTTTTEPTTTTTETTTTTTTKPTTTTSTEPTTTTTETTTTTTELTTKTTTTESTTTTTTESTTTTSITSATSTDLPQTGINSLNNIITVISAFIMILLGISLVKLPDIINNKKVKK